MRAGAVFTILVLLFIKRMRFPGCLTPFIHNTYTHRAAVRVVLGHAWFHTCSMTGGLRKQRWLAWTDFGQCCDSDKALASAAHRLWVKHRHWALHFNILLVTSAISHQPVDILTERTETVAMPGVNHFYTETGDSKSSRC